MAKKPGPAPTAEHVPANDPTATANIKLLKAVASPKLTGPAGHIFTVDREYAEELIAAGAARELTDVELAREMKNGHQPDIDHKN